ncbi:MAG: TIGR01212 family radical SAM protein, partial [Bacteroidetes bacterium]|nr:TIGR01212 family radical SAM protein [Bacteroidota bacterium]
MTKNEIYSWGHSRRFNAYANYHQKIFSERIQKLSIDAGFTCPNRDGSIALGGCTYCNNDAFNPSYCEVGKSISQQLTEGIEFHENRYRRASKYLAYFQAYSNTYDSLNSLKKRYEEALSFENVIGLVIGTRPDCIDEEKLDYLQKLNETHHIVIEFGIESCYNHTLERINRGHSFEQSVKAITMAAERNLFTGTHLIFGLPGESRQEMLAEAKIISD